MAFLFQPPIFGNYILPAIHMNVPTTPIVLPQFTITPFQLLQVYRPVFSPPIRIKVMYHRAGTVLASNDACYNYPPARETVLGNLSWWSEQHGIGDKAYTRRCTLYLTRSCRSILTISPIDGPVSPPDLVKKVSFGDMTAPYFHTLMMDTVTNNYGAFILVDNNSTDNTHPAPPVTRQPSPSSTSSTDAINTNAPEPSKTGDNTTLPSAMDLFITAQEPFAHHPLKAKSFPSALGNSPDKPPGDAKPLVPLPPVSQLEFDLIVHDPCHDSTLTGSWDPLPTPLSIPLNTSRVHLLNLLREKLPVVEASSKNRLSRQVRRPKLISATLYWTYGGKIYPLGPSDKEWHYRDLVTKTDIMAHSELEWFLLKEMMASSRGALKCYISVRGEHLPAKKTSGWWFKNSA
ncbi:hypothetical protein FACUT_13705 [Fusarium acutatum]|uniref:Uncharacterized protein n=1 Tax=Fusarium acutatum TaxID=78861 RepID=A0A8H4JB54_9HYPO|nr:hypothetical protein FACUT_13705 [Fusarium acutatum]